MTSILLEQVHRRLNEAIARLDTLRQRQGRPTLRERHLDLVNSRSRLTHERRREIMERAAKHPGTEKALAKGDAVFARYLELLESGEVQDHHRSGSPASR